MVKNVGADGWRTDDEFCDAVADEIIAHPRISNIGPTEVEISDLEFERKVILRKRALKIYEIAHLELNPPIYFHDWLLIKRK